MLTARLNRIFRPDGRSFCVAIDHGFFNEGAFLEGIEDIRSALAQVAAAGPDGILLSPGQAPILQEMSLWPRPALLLRVDVANIYARDLPGQLWVELLENAVEQSLRLDAAGIMTNLFWMEGRPEVHHACVRNILRLKADCGRYGMPLLIEPLAMRPQPGTGAYAVNSDLAAMTPLVRQAVELGADAVKADPTDRYEKIVEAAGGRPVLVRGGERASDDEVLRRTEALMARGAAGLVYGRNIIQHPNPAGMMRALMAIVHEGSSAAEALLRTR